MPFSYSISFIITLAWIMGKPLTLLFDPYESIVLFLSGPSKLHSILLAVPHSCHLSPHRELRRTRWEIKLARGYDPDVYVTARTIPP